MAADHAVDLGSAASVRDGRRNSFDLLRLLAAFAVMLGHQMDFAGLPELALGPLGISLSNTGLFVFFALSGYLVWRSLERDPRPHRFIAARLRRIYPGAIVNASACLLLGAVVTDLTWADYWRDGETWSYFAHGVAIFVPPTAFTLPGVFTDGRWPNVDTPIWTLKYELLCYTAALAAHRLLVPRLGVLPVLAGLAGLLTAGTAWHLARWPLPEAENFYSRYNAFNCLRFGMVFAAGSLLAATEGLGGAVWGKVARSLVAALVALAPDPSLNRVGLILLVAILAVDLGRSPLLFSRRYRRFGDLSYGIYLYAFPIQSLLMTWLYGRCGLIVVTFLVIGAVVGCAILSWRLVERPALRFKGGL